MTNLQLRQDIESFVRSSGSDRVADYAQRGRKHAGILSKELRTAWIEAFRQMAAEPFDLATHTVHNDLESEMSLRGIEPPYDVVEIEMDQFVSAVDKGVTQMRRDDPDGFAQANFDLEKDLCRHVADKAKGS